MLNQKEYEQAMRSPEMQDLFLSGLIGEAACIIAKQFDITPIEALERFYQSRTCAQLHDRRTGLYLFSGHYLAEEYKKELSASTF